MTTLEDIQSAHASDLCLYRPENRRPESEMNSPRFGRVGVGIHLAGFAARAESHEGEPPFLKHEEMREPRLLVNGP